MNDNITNRRDNSSNKKKIITCTYNHLTLNV